MSLRASGSLKGAGGLRIFTQSWSPGSGTPVRAAVVLVHGLGEHSDRYHPVAERLVDGIDAAVHTLDHRGHGHSQGPRALIETAPAVADLDRLVGQAAAAHPEVPVFMLGHSLGGMIAVSYALRHAERITGLVLSGALVGLDQPPALLRAGRVLSRIAPRAPTIALDPGLLSRSPEVVAGYRTDPLVHHGRIPARTGAQIAETVAGFPDAVGAIDLPTLIMYGTADALCPPWGSVRLAEELGSADVTIRAYEGLYHEILFEPERETVIADLLRWLRAQLGADAAVRRTGRAGPRRR